MALQDEVKRGNSGRPGTLLVLVQRDRAWSPEDSQYGKVLSMGITKVAYPGVLDPAVPPSRFPASTMMVTPSASLDTEGVRSLEVRWIFAGRPATAMAGWFGRFPAQTVTIEDAYLVDPYLPGLSVKVRERRALEVKAYHGSPGLLELPGRARGRLESWQKWSFPCAQASQGSGDPAGWRTVCKRRRISRFSRAGGAAMTRSPAPGEKAGCAVELVEFRALGAGWWTLGFEATGQADGLHGQLESAATLVFGQALPGGAELGIDASMSYAQWLRGQPGIGNPVGSPGA